MNINNLYYFTVAAQELNFSKAAEKLFITQQCLSKHIKKIEEEYGTVLFTRGKGKEVFLTEAGQCFLNNATIILNTHKELKNQLCDISNVERSSFTIGIPQTRGCYMLPRIIEKYHKHFPNVSIRVQNMSSTEVANALERGDVDVGIGLDLSSPVFNYHLVAQDQQYLVVPRTIFTDYFSAEEQQRILQMDAVSLKTFSNCPFLACDSNVWAGQFMNELANAEEFTPNVILQTNDFIVMYRMSKKGLGVCIASQSLLGYLRKESNSEESKMLYFPLDKSSAGDSHKLVLATNKEKYLKANVKNFIETVLEIYSGSPKES